MNVVDNKQSQTQIRAAARRKYIKHILLVSDVGRLGSQSCEPGSQFFEKLVRKLTEPYEDIYL